MCKFPHRWLVSLLFSCLTAPASAAEGNIDVEELIVRPDSSGSSITLTADDTVVPAAGFSDLLQYTPGVAPVGQGGHLQTVAIRGLSGERVRMLLNDAPIRALRRAGTSAAFIQPAWMTVSATTVAGPVPHGSGTTGGYVHATPASELPARVSVGYEAPGRHRTMAASAHRGALRGAFSFDVMNDQKAPDGSRLNTGFEQLSTLLQHISTSEAYSGSSTLLFSNGEDIGKSNSDFPDRTTSYPRDRHLFASHQASLPVAGTFTFWGHAQELQTKVTRDGVRTDVETTATDYGMRYASNTLFAGNSTFAWGADLFGRGNYDAEENNLHAVRDGRELELGLYAQAEHRLHNQWTIGWGARLIHGSSEADNQASVDDTSLVGHLSIGFASRTFGAEIKASRAVTLPTVSQLFFTGTTGRGDIIGNSGLDEEEAWVYELTTRGRFGAVDTFVSAFYMDIDSFIEKIPLTPDIDTFANASGGDIYGFIGELRYTRGPLSVDTGFSFLRGELDNGDPIRDIPNHLAFVRTRANFPAGTLALEVAQRFSSDRVAEGNLDADARTLVSASFQRQLTNRWEAEVFGRNLLDELYYVTNDDKSAFAPERSFGVRLTAYL